MRCTALLIFALACGSSPQPEAVNTGPEAQTEAAAQASTETPPSEAPPAEAPTETPEPAAVGTVGMANPASVYCTEQGGRLEIRDGADGQAGYCHLPDGQVIEEWEYFRANH